MNEFDNKAREWDKESVHWDRSKAIAEGILRMIPIKFNMKALEYGAGTGILSFLLSDTFEEITLMDNSQEMINVIQEKVAKSKSTNLKPLLFNLEQAEFRSDSFDCIFTQMVLHHVFNIELLLNRFYQILNPGGYLVIADLYLEDGSFHGESFTGHNGFDVELLSDSLRKAGFTPIVSEQCFVMKKATGNVLREYPVFLLIAEKSSK
ncbi:class I SAM-dependent methyltransferase [uncultured Bacteroides sp.]|uniref:class I SAM-dependent methyltransferase n=1 Tax=uncultured Bacteroides sp. TaxID=162156 RepID=UPI002AABFF97|nr:class I SAM-dependent methyltransferase [uncultured Bacteroides sp.]